MSAPSELRRLRRLKFELDSAINAYVWTRADWERDTRAAEVRAARERYLDQVYVVRWCELDTPEASGLQAIARSRVS